MSGFAKGSGYGSCANAPRLCETGRGECMKAAWTRFPIVIGILSIGTLLLQSGCASPSTLKRDGSISADNDTLWWILFAVAAAVFVVVVSLFLLALFRGSDGHSGSSSPGNRFVVVGGAIIPAVILFVIFGFTLSTMVVESASASPTALTIEVIGHEWWWQFVYPQDGFGTANEALAQI
jgi:cytochrome c oxidase subunit 2